MARFFFLAVNFVLLNVGLHAQDTLNQWRKGAIGGVQFTQTAFSNWSAGGENSLALTCSLRVFANHTRNKINWDSYFDGFYGFIRTDQYGLRKNDDRWEINSSFGYREKETHWFYTVLVNGISQFDKGIIPPNDSTIVSDLMSPGFVKIAIGMEHKPHDNLRLFLAPLSGKSTIVLNDAVDELYYGLDTNKRWRNEYGAYVKFFFKKEIFKNVIFQNKTDLFSNYVEDPQNIDVSTQIFINMLVNKYMSCGITLDMIYDDNTKVPLFENNEFGVREQVGEGPRLQLKEVFALRIMATF